MFAMICKVCGNEYTESKYDEVCSLDCAEENLIEYIKDRFGLSYLHGYYGSKYDRIYVKCDRCGAVMHYTYYHLMNVKSYKYCKKCVNIPDEDEFERRCNELGMVYLSGFKGYSNYNPVLIGCNKCNRTMYTTANAIKCRYNSHSTSEFCVHCIEDAKAEKEKTNLILDIAHQLNKYINKYNSVQEQQRKRLLYKAQEESKIRYCARCGKEYTWKDVGHHSIYCSDKCKNYLCRQQSNRRKDARERHYRLGDSDITLAKLYERDNGVCHICGQQCDWNDCEGDGVRFYKNYPSIDHLIPISKGGQHSWNNIKLAHIGCNSKKGNKI